MGYWQDIFKRAHLIILAMLLSVAGSIVGTAVQAASSAVIIMYHRFGESDYPATNTTVEQLDTHIQELTTGGYTVLPVAQIVTRLAAGTDLPDRTVGITIDDAYRSVFTVAWPKFKSAGLPITVFVATGHVDQGSSRHLTWDQVREMRDGGATIGHHTVSHLHMVKASPERLAREIDDAFEHFDAKIGQRPGLFAYPYGEANLATMATVKKAGFVAAFGQHSGVVGNTDGQYYLPRFAMNETYGDLARLRLAANALPLVVTDVTPPDHQIGDDNPPAMGFTIARQIGSLSNLACFLSHAGRARVERLEPRIEVRIDKPFPQGRTRLNCTLRTASGRWRWYGRQFYRP